MKSGRAPTGPAAGPIRLTPLDQAGLGAGAACYTAEMTHAHDASPLPDALTADTSTRDLLEGLAACHRLGHAAAMAQARGELEALADDLATGDGRAREVPLLREGQSIRLREFFGGMDAAQARRFVDELFVDLVPHLARQAGLFRHAREGKTDSGAKVRVSPLGRLVAEVARGLPEDLLDRAVHTQARNLTWKDDAARTIDSEMEIVVVEGSLPGKGGMGF